MKDQRISLKKKVSERQGSILTVVILMSVVISLLATALTRLSYQGSLISVKDENRVKAFFLAESGVANAYALLKENFNYKDDPSLFTQTSLGEGSYDVTILQPAGRVLIQSTGSVDSVQKTLKVEVAFDDVYEPFNYGFFSNNRVLILGSSNIDGDIHSNDDVVLFGGCFVNGSITAAGIVSVFSPSGAASTTEDVYRKTFPEFDFNTYYNLAAPEDRYTEDTTFQNVTLTPTNGVIYVDGNISISGEVHLTGVLIATGNITVYGTLEQTGYLNYPALMSRDGNIVLFGETQIGNGIIYTASGNIEIRDALTIQGNVIAYSQIQVVSFNSIQQTSSGQIPVGLILEESLEGVRRLTYHE